MTQAGTTPTDPPQPRVYTTEEVRDMVIAHVHALVHYWSTVKLDPGQPDTVEERVGGVAFSILSMLDGSAMDLPSFIVAPAPHPDDEAYRRGEGENWFPPAPDIESDIAGGLHEIFSAKKRSRP